MRCIAVLMRRVVDDFRFHPAARGINFALNIERHLPLVACDHVQIEQVLLNLLTNSAQAMSATEAEARSIAIDPANSRRSALPSRASHPHRIRRAAGAASRAHPAPRTSRHLRC